MRLAAAAMLILIAAAAPAHAQEPAEPQLELATAGYRELPPGTALRLELMDDSDLNLQVRELIAEELARRGHPVAEGAPFILQIETGTAADDETDPTLGSFEANTDEGAELRLNLWSNRQDSLLNRQEDTTRDAAMYRISLGIYDSRNGRYYWRGNAGALLVDDDALAASREMVPALLARLGQTYRSPASP